MANGAGLVPRTSRQVQSHYYGNASIAFGCVAVLVAVYDAVAFGVLPIELARPAAFQLPGPPLAQVAAAFSFGALIFGAIALGRREGRREIAGLALGLILTALVIATAATIFAMMAPGD